MTNPEVVGPVNLETVVTAVAETLMLAHRVMDRCPKSGFALYRKALNLSFLATFLVSGVRNPKNAYN